MSSYTSPDSSTGITDYNTGVDGYDNDYYYDDGTTVAGGGKDNAAATGIGIAIAVVAVILAVIIIAIIISIIVELKTLKNAVVLGSTTFVGRESQGWLEMAEDAVNGMDSEGVLRRMFPGGFTQVIHFIEGAYKRYRGLDGDSQSKAAKSGRTAKSGRAIKSSQTAKKSQETKKTK